MFRFNPLPLKQEEETLQRNRKKYNCYGFQSTPSQTRGRNNNGIRLTLLFDSFNPLPLKQEKETVGVW
ncbi:hypothetical protein LEP1GSC074_2257 [Leptospira noguchii str. Hook]|nr:hypothetical protein LEP1GSC074_2257 [Leptospira noguchii str. Hook]